MTFDRNVLSDTSTTIAAGVGSVSSTTFSGNTATVQLSGVADRQTITIELDNVVGVIGINSKVLVSMSICIGDVNQTGSVTVEDINLVKSQSGNVATSTTFKYDLNHDAFIDAADTAQDKSVASQGASLYPDFAFTGHFYHARSGLYLAPYRAYNPTIGRWLSRDPIGEAGSLNLYHYVSDGPTNFTDFLGLCKTLKLEISFTSRDQGVVATALAMVETLRSTLAKCASCPCIDVEPVFDLAAGAAGYDGTSTHYPGGTGHRVLFGPTPGGTAGITNGFGTASIIRTFGTSGNVLSHELGHQGGYRNRGTPGRFWDQAGNPRTLLPIPHIQAIRDHLCIPLTWVVTMLTQVGAMHCKGWRNETVRCDPSASYCACCTLLSQQV